MIFINNILPIFRLNKSKVYKISMWDESEFMNKLFNEEIKNQELFQKKLEELFASKNVDVITSWYLENRRRMFEVLWCEQMISEWRFFHLWLDLSVKKWTEVFSPIDWEVFEVWYEEWEWNYGWYVILKHILWKELVYSLYWHLSYENINLKVWELLNAWKKIWIIWDFHENWWYFYHTHLQVITEKWKQNWFFTKWYCSYEQLKNIWEYIVDPNILFTN